MPRSRKEMRKKESPDEIERENRDEAGFCEARWTDGGENEDVPASILGKRGILMHPGAWVEGLQREGWAWI